MPPTDPHDDHLAAAVADMRVILATVAGDVKAILGRLDAQAQVQADHETRIRVVEQTGCQPGIYGRSQVGTATADIETRVRSLERWRWSIPSLAAVFAFLSLGVAVYSTVLHNSH